MEGIQDTEVIHNIDKLKFRLKQLKTAKQKLKEHSILLGFVPTMGSLHEGHRSLLKKAREECDIVVLSIFVNPLQFGPTEDFMTYPRNEQSDYEMAKEMRIDIVFIPSVEEMYPTPTKTQVKVTGITEQLCGASRPGHFDGVATVVMKLFHIVEPSRAYFGMKDAQQVVVIKQMVQDLNMNVDIVACDIVREPSGLAMSSRNKFLNSEQRDQAVVLYKSLQKAEQQINERVDITIEELQESILEIVHSSSLAYVDYIQLLKFPSFEDMSGDEKVMDILMQTSIIIALAVKFGTTRLIDNRVFLNTI